MHIKFTARRFRARQEVKEHAIDQVKRLDHFFDGIVGADVILSFEGAEKNIKIAEVNLYVHGSVLTAKQKTNDFRKSIDAVTEKLSMQLEKYKSKLRAKDKNKVRAMKTED
jgi:ribosome hibernation promoting factor